MELASTLLSTALTVARYMDGSYEATGSYQFSPQVAQVEACKRAEERAKVAILQKAIGHEFTSDRVTACKEVNDQHSCKHYDTSYEYNKGHIKSIIDRKESVKDWTCNVTVKALVSETKQYTSTNFDLSVNLPKNYYVNGESLEFDVTTSAYSFLYAYIYTPDDGKLRKVFPLGYESPLVPFSKQRTVLPKQYPIKLSTSKETEEQYLFVFITGFHVNPMDTYELKSFYEMWDSMTTARKLVRKGYIIVRK